MNVDPRIDSLLARWHESNRRGEPLTAEELCRDCPELREELTRHLARAEPTPSPMPPEQLPTSAPLPPSQPHACDPTVPGYEVLEEIGRGGMGVVYKAKQTALGRVVALKMILSGSQAGSDERERFLTEARAAAELDHHGIVKVHEFGTHAGQGYCVMEFCEGGNLSKLLGGRPLQPNDAAAIVEQIARAVQAAHQKKIVHRDLKPANVLVAADGTYKVADFGLAKRLESGAGMTQTGAIMGTPSYVSPEQARGKKDVGPAADVYSLGAILYECLTGRPPFLAATAFDTLAQVINDDPVQPRTVQKTVPRDLETICLKCLHKDAARRYAGAVELADDLRCFLEGRPIRARPVGQMERAWKWVKRRPLAASLASITALALTATLLLLVVAVVGQQRRHEIELSRRLEEQKRQDAEVFAEQLQTILAIALARSLEPGAGDALLASTVDSLEELARSPPPKRVRMMMFERATTDGYVGKRLGALLRPLLRALVGLDRGFRDEVIEALGERLDDQSIPPQCKILAARGVVQLGQGEGEKGRQALAMLVRTSVTEVGPEHPDGDRCLTDLLEASRSLDEQSATAVVEAIADHFAAVESATVAYRLAAVFERASKSIPAERAEWLAARVSGLALARLRALNTSQDAPGWRYVRVLRHVAPSLDRAATADVLARLLELTKGQTDPSVLEEVSLAFEQLAPRAAEGRFAAAKHFATKAVDQLARERGRQAASLSTVVAVVAPHLTREDGAAVARSLGKVIGVVDYTDQQQAAAEMARALLPRLGQKETVALAQQATTLIGREVKGVAEEGFAALKLTVTVSAVVFGCASQPKERRAELAGPLVKGLKKSLNSNDPFIVSEVARGLADVADKLGGTEAPDALAELPVWIAQVTPANLESYEYYLLVRAMETAAPRTDEARAKAFLASVNQLPGPHVQSGRLWVLAAGYAAVAGRVPEASSAPVRKHLFAALEREMATEKRPGFRLYLARGLRALGDLDVRGVGDVAVALARKVGTEQTKPGTIELRIDASTLDTLRPLLPSKERDRHCSRVATALAGRVSIAPVEELGPLAKSYREMLKHHEKQNPPEQTAQIAKRLTASFSQTNSREHLLTLVEAYWQVKGWVDRAEADVAVWEVSSALTRAAGQPPDDLAGWSETALSDLTDAQLIELLKFPLSVTWMEGGLLRALEKRSGRAFPHVWAVVTWAGRHFGSTVILTTPARLPPPR